MPKILIKFLTLPYLKTKKKPSNSTTAIERSTLISYDKLVEAFILSKKKLKIAKSTPKHCSINDDSSTVFL